MTETYWPNPMRRRRRPAAAAPRCCTQGTGAELRCRPCDDFAAHGGRRLTLPDDLGTVFISYSHDSPDHARAVLLLSNKLRSEGIDCILDQYESSPPEGWPRWMDREVKKAQFVLMVCTERYYRRVMGEEAPGVGLGVAWESTIIYSHIFGLVL
jgi:hypothetical protein